MSTYSAYTLLNQKENGRENRTFTQRKVFCSCGEISLASHYLDAFGDDWLSQFFTDTESESQDVRAAIKDMPVYDGTLVAKNGQATLIVAELFDQKHALETYTAIEALVDQATTNSQDTILIAGEGAVSGYLSNYIDQDAMKLNPLAGLIITLVLALGFMTLRATLLPNLIVLCTALTTLGLMAASGTPFYVITNGLIVCMVGIAVADTIHTFSTYYEMRQGHPDATQQNLVVKTMVTVFKPITLTTITTIAGFLALYPTSDMPPIQAFGLFGALAVFVAWLYTVTLFSAVLSLLKPRSSRSFTTTNAKVSIGHRVMTGIGQSVIGFPRLFVVASIVLVVVGFAGLSQVQTEDQRIENFKSTEPLYQADKAINKVMSGTYNLDIIIESSEFEGLHNPQTLHKIARLQEYLQTLPHINGTMSIVDYIKQLNRAVNENQTAEYRIPDSSDLIAQLFLLYSISADPADFDDKLNNLHTKTVVRAYLDTNTFSNNRQIVPAVTQFLESEFNQPGLTAQITGRVNVDYHWLNGIAKSHANSVVISVLAVFVMAALLFRSLTAGLLTVTPVAVAILLIYATMGFANIWLGIGTSMFASIAIGLGIDFSIHTLEKLQKLAQDSSQTLSRSLLEFYGSTGRALFLNALSLALGFGVLCFSEVPPLIRFGGLVMLAVSSAFIASVTLLPALVLLFTPAQIVKILTRSAKTRVPEVVTGLAIVAVASFALVSHKANATELPDARSILALVDQRPEGEMVTKTFELKLTDKNGKGRIQDIKSFRRYFNEQKKTILFYTAPANLVGTGFLTFDYLTTEEDSAQWLYLPALRKIRRIPASKRGDNFLGTDFKYDEIKSENKINRHDYYFTMVEQSSADGFDCFLIEGIPKNDKIIKELGYSRAQWCIDPTVGISRQSEFWDTNGNYLKTIRNSDIEQVDGIWTVMQVSAINHKTGHKTLLTMSEVDYQSFIEERLFEQRSLTLGL
ncbi:outer membrane lipoprotein-sorting protein [Reinekea sp.]|uniref:outer membrane lipoprotein-sorting protein n=1 Tax=Reinekea sp. TaxID=1970455 RepID=UPI00257A6F3D|nr:outer membrane lipoprotein-sorting protein [Reinekea sp.]